jgi:AraC family transcriptional regulator
VEDNNLVQKTLNEIEAHITEAISPGELAGQSGYSTIHFSRVFAGVTGITLMAYITRRKLQYALYDVSCGEKIIDVAVKYGFETHAGFTKAFKKCFGYPPSIYRVHAICSRPTRMGLEELRSIVSGGIILYPEIVEMKPINAAGYTSRHKMLNVKYTHDIPLYWDTINMEFADPLTRLHDLFKDSKHSEITLCFDIKPAASEFTYFLGVGVDSAADLNRAEPDMYRMKIPGGLYAKFTTPLTEEAKHIQAVRDTWKNIFDKWLPASEYHYDEQRYDYEYYDLRDHAWENNGMEQMDIFIPIRKR